MEDLPKDPEVLNKWIYHWILKFQKMEEDIRVLKYEVSRLERKIEDLQYKRPN